MSNGGAQPITDCASMIQRNLGDNSASYVVIEALAEHYDTDPLELEPPLYEVIDPNALDKLGKSSNLKVTFPYNDIEVHVHGDEKVIVKPE